MNDVYLLKLDKSYISKVKIFDQLSENNVSDKLDQDGYAWGLFNKDEKLLGYCTIGGVENTDHYLVAKEANEIESSLSLSNVFIHPYCRRFGYGTLMVSNLIKSIKIDNPHINTIYVTIHNAQLYDFYEKIGFKELEDGILYYTCACEKEGNN